MSLHETAYQRIVHMVYIHSYERYLIILSFPKYIRRKLFILTALHMELHACLRYYQTPFILSMRLVWWRQQLEGRSCANDVLLLWNHEIHYSDTIRLVDAFENGLEMHTDAFSNLLIINFPYIDMWFRLTQPFNKLSGRKYHSMIVLANKLCVYWIYWKLMNLNILSRYGVENREIVIKEGAHIQALWKQLSFSERKKIKVFYLLKRFGDLYQIKGTIHRLFFKIKLYLNLLCV